MLKRVHIIYTIRLEGHSVNYFFTSGIKMHCFRLQLFCFSWLLWPVAFFAMIKLLSVCYFYHTHCNTRFSNMLLLCMLYRLYKWHPSIIKDIVFSAKYSVI